MATRHRVGFVSTRLAGTDGVSLEVRKWAAVLEGLGCECFYFAGECDWPDARSYVAAEAHFMHPDVMRVNKDLFDDYRRSAETARLIEKLRSSLEEHLLAFVRRFDLELLIPENALSIPMNVPLGLALTSVIAETGIQTLAHHHDFAWERERFDVGAADDYLRAAFPPTFSSIVHVVINSFAQRQLALRAGVASLVVPNVMDFESPPPEPDDYAADLRARLGVGEGEYLLLQPTRVVPRKRIERAVELARRLELPCALVISHASGDEGDEYRAYLEEYIRLMGVKVVQGADIFAGERGRSALGEKVYSLADAHFPADLVTYPSSVEGFGNAFLEAVYYRKPIVMSAYEIYRVDIQPKGFRVVEFSEFITEETVRQARDLLLKPDLAAEMVEHNYAIARRHYSYSNLERLLDAIIRLRLGS